MQELFFKIKSYLNYRLKAVNAHGLHSPFLFDFYNEVIAAQKEFYFFKRFRAILLAYSDSISQRDALFLYRWSVFFKAKSVCVSAANFPVSLALAKASSKRELLVSSLHDFSQQELSVFECEGVFVKEGARADLSYIEEVSTDSKELVLNCKCVIIEKPYRDKAKYKIWNELCNLKEVSISIDLYQFGILLVDKKQAKQHFTVKMY